MKFKNILKRFVLLVVCAGFGLFLMLLYFVFSSDFLSGKVLIINNATDSSIKEIILPEDKPDRPGLPVHLKIPILDIDSNIEYVGFTDDNAMDVPKNQDDVAWLKFGQRPGEVGTAIIAGHYGWQNSRSSVFDNLHTLRPGDKLYTEDESGKIISFVVRENRRYNPDIDAVSVFSSNDGKSHLNLITCEGNWDKLKNSYPKRLVIFADKE